MSIIFQFFSIQVIGDYHEFGEFVSGVASLPRIVTVHNVSIARVEKSKGGLLRMSMTAKTYRYLDEEEAVNNSSKGKKKKKGGKK